MTRMSVVQKEPVTKTHPGALINKRSTKSECIAFLQFSKEGEIEIDLADSSRLQSEIDQIEYIMNSICEGSLGVAGKFRVVLVNKLPQARTIFSAREYVGNKTLGECVGELTGIEYMPDDVLFLRLIHDFELFRNLSFEDRLHLAIHNIGCLIAATVIPKARNTLYLCTCLLLIHSLDDNLGFSARMIDDFLRLWLRDVLDDNGDPPVWDEKSLEEVEVKSPLNAMFMSGLGDAISHTSFLQLPASLQAISDCAKGIQALAILDAVNPKTIN